MNRDFFDMLSALSESGAEFLVVGAHAVSVHAEPRATGDLDLWVRPTRANAGNVPAALKAFGAPLIDLTVDDLVRPGTVFQIGVVPCRIDILSSVSGLEFDEAWPGRLNVPVGDLRVPFLGREALIRNKRATGRPKDLADLVLLGEPLPGDPAPIDG